MDTDSKPDRLLIATRWVLTLLIWFVAAAALLCVALVPIVLAQRGQVIRELVANGIAAEAFPWMVALLALAAAMATVAFFFFRHLKRIVASVSDGDPFAPVNADRLFYMGWLCLVLQALLMAATPLFVWFDALPDKPNVHYGDNGFSIGGVVMALLLFVLARVFRVGAAMRDDLEGTV